MDRSEFSQLGTPVEIDELAYLGHHFEIATVEVPAPGASVQVHAHCRLCGMAFQIERATRQPWPWTQWQLADGSQHPDQPCHSRRALMLQNYSRIRSLIDEKDARVES
jgi:hypothetical protein